MRSTQAISKLVMQEWIKFEYLEDESEPREGWPLDV
jgi:hypothetical protein